MVRIIVAKEVDGHWYRHGVYSDFEQACIAYANCAKYADAVKLVPEHRWDEWEKAGHPKNFKFQKRILH